MNRQFDERAYRRMVTRFRALVKAVGGLDEAARATRLKRSILGDFQNPNVERFAPVDVIADLELACGQPLVTELLAELSGNSLKPLEGYTHSNEDVVELMIEGNQSHHELQQIVTKYLADGKLDRDEIKSLLVYAEADYVASKRFYDVIQEADNKLGKGDTVTAFKAPEGGGL